MVSYIWWKMILSWKGVIHMKLLVEREPYEDWELEVDCTGGEWRDDKVPCGSTSSINATDLVRRKWCKYPDDNGVDYGFICPKCGCFTNIDEKNLTKDLKTMAKDYIEKI